MKFEVLKEKMDRWHFLLLALIFAIALVLRVVGAGWGMPNNNLHPDEVLIFEPAHQCALNHNFEVHDYYRPNHVSIKLNTILYTVIQEVYFAPRGQADFASNYNENFSLFTTASRVMAALFGVGVVVLAYLIGRFWGRGQALFAALLSAVFPSFIEHSHYITPDILLLFFMMGVLWMALRYQRKPSVSLLFGMSMFTALAVCEKYPGIYCCVVIAAAVIMTHIKKPLKIVTTGCLAVLFVVLGIMAVSPVLLIDWRTVLEVMAGQNHANHLGADGLNFWETIIFYLKTTGVHMGLILTVSGIYGIVRSLRKNLKQTILLLVFGAYIVPISTLSIHWERYTLPIYITAIFFGAFGVFYLFEDLQRFFKNKTVFYLAACMILVLLPTGSLALGAVAVTGSFLAPDSRIVLQSVFAEMGVDQYNTAYDCNTPLDPGGYYGAFMNFEEADPARYKYGGRITFVMTSSAERDLYLESDPEVYGWIANFYRKLDENYPLVCLFPVEKPSSHFIELSNIWYAARSIYRYMRGASTGYEIRLYQILP